MYSSFAATLRSRGEALNLYKKRAGGGFKCFLIPRRRMKYGKAMSASNIGRILSGTGLSEVRVMGISKGGKIVLGLSIPSLIREEPGSWVAPCWRYLDIA